MLSTMLISIKLFITFVIAARKAPGYVEPDPRPEFEFKELLKSVPAEKLCPYTKVIMPPRSKYCHICERVTDRYETHCVWLNNCVGRHNATYYFMFIFYVWLDVFLLGWIAMSSIQITECNWNGTYDTPCYYEMLCVGCNNHIVHYIVTVGDMVLLFFLTGATTWPMLRQFYNYSVGETSYERFQRRGRSQSLAVRDTA